MTATASATPADAAPADAAPATGLPLSPPANLRDLGGIPTATGAVRPGFAWRADDLSLVDADSASRLVADGLSTVVDLRSIAEVETTGRGLLGTHPVAYHHVPFMASINEAVDKTPSREGMWDQSRFADMYISLFETAAPQIVSSLAIIAHAPGAAVFHCAAGQDRTGVLAAALLLAVGTPDEAIVTDYARTGENIAAVSQRVRPVIEPMMARMGMKLDPGAMAAVRTTYSTAPMLGLLTHLRDTYTDPLQPLYEAGFSAGLRDLLRARALSA